MCRLFKTSKSFINNNIFQEYNLKRMLITFIQLIVNTLIFIGSFKLNVF